MAIGPIKKSEYSFFSTTDARLKFFGNMKIITVKRSIKKLHYKLFIYQQISAIGHSTEQLAEVLNGVSFLSYF